MLCGWCGLVDVPLGSIFCSADCLLRWQEHRPDAMDLAGGALGPSPPGPRAAPPLSTAQGSLRWDEHERAVDDDGDIPRPSRQPVDEWLKDRCEAPEGASPRLVSPSTDDTLRFLALSQTERANGSPPCEDRPSGQVFCFWCGVEEVSGMQVYCSHACRSAAWRFRRRSEFQAVGPYDRKMRLAYADPPFPGKAYLYVDQPSYAGEVDHVELVRGLIAQYDGWALSTGWQNLADVLPLCPRGRYRIHPWVKPNGVSRLTYGAHNAWEALIVVPARRLRPGFRDFLCAKPARGQGHTLIGRKPSAFAAHLFRALGADPRDDFEDLYPGTGMIGRCWRAWVSAHQEEKEERP